MDTFSRRERSFIMRCVHANDTTPEKKVRSFLHRRGLRFRLHVKNLPGRPDIVLPKYKTIVEVRGCFWHRHPGCKMATTPLSNTAYWDAKFKRNVERDRRNELMLSELGWRVIIVWECQLKTADFLDSVLGMILK